jgi:predicted DCC family thiol-disulfide oxidoreductase YuxK
MIVLFDGECNFCNRSVQFIYERDKKGAFRFAALQSEKGMELLKQHGLSDLGISSVVFIKDNKAFIRSSAGLRICKHLKGFWPMMIIFLAVPKFVRDWVYDGIAKRRNRLLKDKCAVPTGEFKSRFLS